MHKAILLTPLIVFFFSCVMWLAAAVVTSLSFFKFMCKLQITKSVVGIFFFYQNICLIFSACHFNCTQQFCLNFFFIEQLIDSRDEPADEENMENINTAIFYSISSTQPGLQVRFLSSFRILIFSGPTSLVSYVLEPGVWGKNP